MNNPTAPPLSQPGGLEGLVVFLMRHFVALAGTRYDLDDRGQPTGQPHFFACSGFVMTFGGKWFLVTAGHVLRTLDRLLQAGRIRFTCNLVDYFGPDARVELPTPFDYETSQRFHIDDDDGLDFGLIRLRPLYRVGLEANGIVPIGEENWLRQHEVTPEVYTVVGLPAELNSSRTLDGPGWQQVIGTVQPVMMTVRRLERPPADVQPTTLPWFVGQLPQQLAIPDIRGMSGGPIFGFRKGASGQWMYWVVALQSRWLPARRIAFGCPVPEFASRVMAAMEDTDHGDLAGEER
jgi:hypothetical protein